MFAARPDDPSIPSSDDLWRRLHPNHVVRDQNIGGFRISSAAFTGEELSVYLKNVVRNSGRSLEDLLAKFPACGMLAFLAGSARDHGQVIVRDPEPEEPAHALVVGEKPGSIRRSLARLSRIIAAPEFLES